MLEKVRLLVAPEKRPAPPVTMAVNVDASTPGVPVGTAGPLTSPPGARLPSPRCLSPMPTQEGHLRARRLANICLTDASEYAILEFEEERLGTGFGGGSSTAGERSRAWTAARGPEVNPKGGGR
jgi:hypothetical protein